MILHYIKIAYRSLMKYRLQSVLSIVGLRWALSALPCRCFGYVTNRRMTVFIVMPAACFC